MPCGPHMKEGRLSISGHPVSTGYTKKKLWDTRDTLVFFGGGGTVGSMGNGVLLSKENAGQWGKRMAEGVCLTFGGGMRWLKAVSMWLKKTDPALLDRSKIKKNGNSCAENGWCIGIHGEGGGTGIHGEKFWDTQDMHETKIGMHTD